MSSIGNFLVAHRGELWTQTLEHLALTLVSLVAAIVFGGALGIWLTRNRRLSSPVLGLTGIVQTIPSLALLGFLIPLLGIGAAPAILALFLYGLLPIVRNTFTGVTEVDPSVREAALGMGMTDRQLLVRVELPLALPVIFAGIRTAAVINVGIATLAALIGAGGLGSFIFRGISLNDPTMTLAGAAPAAVLALLFDGILAFVQRQLRRRLRPLLAVVLVLLLAIVAWQWPARPVAGASLRVAAPPEFVERADGYRGFAATYDFGPRLVEMQHGLMYQALREHRVDAVFGYSTDGEIAAFGLTLLGDDAHYFPPYQAAPIVRRSTLDEHPQVRDALNAVAGRLTDRTMAALNARVEHGKESADFVARSFLSDEGFELAAPRRGAPGDIVIGSKIFAEQYILAEMFAALIESRTELTVELKTGLGGTQICFEALKRGDIDLYPEYTGTGLLAILATPANIARPLFANEAALFDFVSSRFSERFDIAWLRPLGFDNSYALIVTAENARAWKVETVSDLVRRSRSRER